MMTGLSRRETMTDISKNGFRLTFTLEETEYYESLVESYRDILDVLKKENIDKSK